MANEYLLPICNLLDQIIYNQQNASYFFFEYNFPLQFVLLCLLIILFPFLPFVYSNYPVKDLVDVTLNLVLNIAVFLITN